MRALLLDVQRESGVPFVMVTHDLYEAVALADTLVVYAGNGATQVGGVRDLLGDPATPEVRRLLHAVDLPDSVFAGKTAGRIVPLNRKEHVA